MATLITVLLSGLLIAVGYALARGVTIGLRRTGWDMPRTRKLASPLLLTLVLLELYAILYVHVHYPLWGSLLEGHPTVDPAGIGLVVVSAAVRGLFFLVGLYVVVRGFKPLAHHQTAPPGLKRWVWKAVALFLVPASVLVDLAIYEFVPVSPTWIVLGLIVVAVWYYLSIAIHLNGALPGPTRAPTDDERTRIERCFERFGRSPGTIVLFEEDFGPTSVVVCGRGGSRWICLEEAFLEEATDDDLAVALAHMDWKHEHYFWEKFYLNAALFSLVLFVSIYLFVQFPPAGIVWLLTLVFPLTIGTRHLRSCTHRADAFASTRLGADTVRDALERISEDLRCMGETGKARTEFEPSLESRLEHLDEQFSLPPRNSERESGADADSSGRDDDVPPDEQSDSSTKTERSSPSVEPTESPSRPTTGSYWGIIASLFGLCLLLVLVTVLNVDFWDIRYNPLVWMVFCGPPIFFTTDTEKVHDYCGWPNRPFLVSIVASIPILNLPIGFWYLWKRRSVVRAAESVPRPDE